MRARRFPFYGAYKWCVRQQRTASCRPGTPARGNGAHIRMRIGAVCLLPSSSLRRFKGPVNEILPADEDFVSKVKEEMDDPTVDTKPMDASVEPTKPPVVG